MLKHCYLYGIFLLPFLVADTIAQPISQRYLMAFHSCGVEPCGDPRNHVVRVAESDDGEHWRLVANIPELQGSVPDLVMRDSTLYIFTPGQVRRYNIATRRWEGPFSITITDSAGTPIRFVDPSATVDSAGRLVLFFLNTTTTPIGQDPAGCSNYPCTKHFDSGIEVAGSNGTQFQLSSGHRVALVINAGVAADPDIYYDGSVWRLLIARNGIMAFRSATLQGEYTPVPLPDGRLTSQASVPSGFFDTATARYWTFGHVLDLSTGHTVIRRAIHSNFDSSLDGNDFTTVIAGNGIGLGDVNVESPSITVNTFGTIPEPQPKKPIDWKPYFTIPADRGMNFQYDTTTVIPNSGVPKLGVDPGEGLLLYFSGSQTGVARLLENGTVVQRFEDFPDRARGDGGFVYLPDGSIRYITEEPAPDRTPQRHKSRIVSYISTDGVHWGKESGIRYQPGIEDDSISSVPAVLQVKDSVWRMYYVADYYRTNGARTAISSDWGMTWQRESNGNILRVGDVDPQPVYLSDGRVRLYHRHGFNPQNPAPLWEQGIAFTDSPDGVTFDTNTTRVIISDTVGEPLFKLDPSVVIFPNGDIACYIGASSQSGGKLVVAWDRAKKSGAYTEQATTALRLWPIMPNPVRSKGIVHCSIPTPGLVTISAVDVAGREIAQILHQFLESGEHVLTIEDLPVATVFLLLRQGENVEIQRVMR